MAASRLMVGVAGAGEIVAVVGAGALGEATDCVGSRSATADFGAGSVRAGGSLARTGRDGEKVTDSDGTCGADVSTL